MCASNRLSGPESTATAAPKCSYCDCSAACVLSIWENNSVLFKLWIWVTKEIEQASK